MSFSHLDDSVPEEEWARALAGRSSLDLDQLCPPGTDRLVVLAAHPDDETLGAGGLIAAFAARGAAVDVVVATAGEASHPESPTHTREDLARIRRVELRAAVAQLAPKAAVHFLDLPDGGLAAHRPALDAALAAVVGPAAETTILAAPWRTDGHTDHDTAGLAAAALARTLGLPLLEYPIWLWHWGSPEQVPADLVLLPLGGAAAAKARAMETHVSQVRPLSAAPGDEALLSPGVLAHFERSFESFVLTRPRPPREVFEDLYQTSSDPWQFESSFYEHRKRALSLAMLPRPRFASVFEPGCSIGVLTQELAARAQAVTATDISDSALDLARRRLAAAPHVRLAQGAVPQDWPEGRFDLVVVSEIGYFLQPSELRDLAARTEASLTDDGVILLCHWRHPNDGWELTGDQVHEVFRAQGGLRVLAEHCEEDFRIDVLVRTAAASAGPGPDPR
ncbi:bifunctional PIG-L family deacetylase/class I SAM-dependent methyltransferase [Arthrobacter sp. zg-Y820]|uniref:bifunctional PIG-L family deacetylase/class I SAM-dependent methyltransferase n=1 Tax=unclassified Arthrobacter TaxID=235627 RepID=UPI00253FE0A1|nr:MULTISPECIES: bifunctional PIG-L family deacetylase/class I SAM-dependent methyltransferase [unclassified Arthrobacter]MCC9197406.1 PIG-L family deacetylase [Arthrobacter sp. zg-Y820]MDK1280272.1 bifunctional PIG-L family deacetylase/class I SAM-dependent methyltransferase [Arthrobacter sp. zg.Y820]WIB09559.1 bifunctional PIG-L family deacetylase/class I SAM-dependent methyltransferase [Arthrobacter sp. zg-Y820]